MLLKPGTHVGRYEVLGLIAIGGMAELHLARATGIEGFEKLVVLKRILPQHAEDQEFVRMFLDEARLAARLHHGNVAQVYDIGLAEGAYYFTMEFVHGKDLASVLTRAAKLGRGFKREHSVAVICGVAAGLHHAHEQIGTDGRALGIVHRDVSPTNVLLGFDGAVKVVDFGVAKAAIRQARTTGGTIKGKICYMSPEQARGGTVDRRSDVFAIGIMLYELTTGRRLFKGESDYAIAKQILDEDVASPTLVRPGYPEALERIVLRALRRDPDERYPTAQALLLELEGFARDERLAATSATLESLMQELFADEIAAWRVARTSGVSLAEHVQLQTDPAPQSPAAEVESRTARRTAASPARRRRSRRKLIAGVAAMAAAGAAGLWIASARRSETSAAPAPDSVATAAVDAGVGLRSPEDAVAPAPPAPEPQVAPAASILDAGPPARTEPARAPERAKRKPQGRDAITRPYEYKP